MATQFYAPSHLSAIYICFKILRNSFYEASNIYLSAVDTESKCNKYSVWK